MRLPTAARTTSVLIAFLAFLIGQAIDIGGYTSRVVANVLFGIAGLALIVLLLTFVPAIRRWLDAHAARAGTPAPSFERKEHSRTTPTGTMTAWEETRRGQNAIATTPTVAATASVPAPSIIQGDRRGWRAWSTVEPQQGHGAVLHAKSESELAGPFRCRVVCPDTGYVDMTLNSSRQPEVQAHYPRAFPGAPPLSPGGYAFSWLGYVEGNTNELLLAKGSFKVNTLGQVYGAGG